MRSRHMTPPRKQGRSPPPHPPHSGTCAGARADHDMEVSGAGNFLGNEHSHHTGIRL